MKISERMRHAMGERTLLAGKVALAAGTAWVLAPFMPGVAAEFPYYAPLGAVITMHPTFVHSFRVGLETLLGIVLGILLAGAFVLLSVPPLAGIMLVTGVGVLLGGLPRVGAGRDYLPISALFVLVLGGGDADGYSFGYLVQMGLGILVGITVNFVVFPPLRTATATLDLEQFRQRLARDLDAIADDVGDRWPPDGDVWHQRAQALLDDSRRVRAGLDLGGESARGNPRAKLLGIDQSDDYVTMNALDSISFQVHDLTELLAGPLVGEGLDGDLPESFRRLVARCLRDASARTAADGETPDDAPETGQEPFVELEEWLVSEPAAGSDNFQVQGSVAKCLHRIRDALHKV